MSVNKYKKLTEFLFEVGSLRKIVRAHQQEFFTSDPTDNISSHSYRVAIIGHFLTTLEKADTGRVVLMCLFHDVPETRSNDQNWVHKKYVKVFEDEIIKDQTRNLPSVNKLRKTISEYSDRKSKESLIAKDADVIDQILLLKEYESLGVIEAKAWLNSKEQENSLKTKSAQKLAREINKIKRPNSWTDSAWTSKRR